MENIPLGHLEQSKIILAKQYREIRKFLSTYNSKHNNINALHILGYCNNCKFMVWSRLPIFIVTKAKPMQTSIGLCSE
jgi:hypothetical protein